MMTQNQAEIAWLTLRPPPFDANGPATLPFTPLPDGAEEHGLFALIETAAARHGDRIAVEDASRQLSYRQILDAACALAHRIVVATPNGGPVALLLQNDAFYPVAVFACLAAGRIAVPLDRAFPATHNLGIVNAVGARAVVIAADAAQPIELPAGMKRIEFDFVSLPHEMSAPVVSPLRADDPAFIIYTSGSTGQPKGVVLSQRTVIHRAGILGASLHVGPDDKILSLGSPATVGGIQQFMEALLYGASLVKVDPRLQGFGGILRLIASRRVTMLFGTPSLLRALAQLDDGGGRLGSLRIVHPAGEVLLRADVDLLHQALPPDCRIFAAYGATEAPGLLQWFVPKSDLGSDAVVAAGFALPDCDYAILPDPIGSAPLTPLPLTPGAFGELVVRSRYLALGEWESGRLVPGRLPADPHAPQTRIYRTGDLVRLTSEGAFVVAGRRDRQVKINGNRIEPAEIENFLRQSLNVKDAAVVADTTGDNVRLIAFVVAQPGIEGDIVGELRREIRRALPLHLQPARIIQLATMPLLPGAKIDEHALLARAALPVAAEPFAPPALATGTAYSVQATWTRILGRASHDADLPFDAAGGDSLEMLRFIFLLEEQLGRRLPLDLFYLGLRPSDFVAALDQPSDAGTLIADRRQTVFLLPGIAGFQPSLARIRALCSHRLNIVALPYPGWQAMVQPGVSFSTIVEDSIAQIVAHAPTGPIRLLGHSFGGWVAYHAAAALIRAGRSVTYLGLLDTGGGELAPQPAPRLRRFVSPATWRAFLTEFRADPWLTILRRTLPGARASRRPLRDLLLMLAKFHAPLALRPTAFLVHQYLSQSLRVALAKHAIAETNMGPIATPTFLFRAADEQHGGPDDDGWRARCPNLKLLRVPGTHITMTDDENLPTLCQKIVETTSLGTEAA